MRFELLQPHEHAGSARAAGDVIELADDLGQWLCGLGVAQPVAGQTGEVAASPVGAATSSNAKKE